MNYLQLILGALTGSVGTSVIRALWERFQKKEDFEREIRKMTYSKKLEKAEAAAAFYYTYISRITVIKKSYEGILSAIKEFNAETLDITAFQNAITANAKEMETMENEKFATINAVHLYFDLDDRALWNEGVLGDVLKAFADVAAAENNLKLWTNLYAEYEMSDHEKAERCMKKAIELIPTFIPLYETLIIVLEKNKTASDAMLRKLKEQVKKY